MNVPQALGYARIAGMPVITGFYTLLPPLVMFAGLGLTTASKNLDTFWTLSRLLPRQIPHKYLISLSGEVAEWSKAPDC